jgi:hypothetical protein
LESVSTETLFVNPQALFSDGKETFVESPIIAVFDPVELAFELGVWLAGLDSFARSGGIVLGGKHTPSDENARECRLTHAALLNCAKLNFRLRKSINGEPAPNLATSDLDDFSLVLRDAIVMNESILSSGKVDFSAWRAWSKILSEKLNASPAHRKLVDQSNEAGERFLPERLKNLLGVGSIPFAEDVELQLLVGQLGALLGSLKIVNRMLKADEPLKPSLIIFSHVYDQTNDLIVHINNRLSRFPSEEAAIFDSLDSASYTASLELKKVFGQELTGLSTTRPVPSVFSRVETACELLSESFRQILSDFAKVIDPGVVVSELFAEFKIKLDESKALRRHLWVVLKAVQAAEQQPSKPNLDAATSELRSFLDNSLGFLFHKDMETLERFCEEIFATSEKNDIVPILHRFGAYLETLLGQVNMRTVLANHPFDPNSK